MFLGRFLCFFPVLYGVGALKILGIFPFISHSHHIIGYTLLRDLSLRGHDVTMISPFPVKEEDGNLTKIVLTGFLEEWARMMKDNSPVNHHFRPAIFNFFFIESMGLKVTEDTLAHENVQKFLKSAETFDIVLLEQFIFDGLMAIPANMGVPFGLVSCIGPSTWSNHLVGNPDIPSYMPNALVEPPVHPYFFKRVHNMLLYIVHKAIVHLYVQPRRNAIVQKYFPNSPPTSEIIYNSSLIIYNSHSAYSNAVPLMPNTIEIGGFHVGQPKKLSEDLQKVLDNAKSGVIYFSMGSVLQSKDFDLKLRREILRALSKLKETVLWKFEGDLPEKPSNVIIRKWFPQTDVLAHPNVKLFITHGGLLSTIESLYRGVPIVGIPVFGDQQMNMADAVHNGHGRAIPFAEVSETTLSQAIEEVLSNPKYAQNVKRSSRILRDKQIEPLDKAEYWIKYVVEHGGARHLRSAALDLTWYQHASIDVILFLIIVNITSVVILCKIVKCLLCRRKAKKEKTN